MAQSDHQDDNVSVASHASATYNEVKDLLQGIFSNNPPTGNQSSQHQPSEYGLSPDRHRARNSNYQNSLSQNSRAGGRGSRSPNKRHLSN